MKPDTNDPDLWQHVFNKRMDVMEARVDENTEATMRIESSTKEVVELLQSWRGAMAVLTGVAKLLRPIGWIAGAIAAVWSVISIFKGGGK